jgi:Domain of unknown function (DUF6089)
MKQFFYILISLIAINQGHAQLHEIGVFVGGSNFIGDVGKTNFIAPNETAIGLIYKWNRSKRHSWRFTALTAKVSGNDLEASIPGREDRGLKFENQLTELSAGLEFNFFDFDLHENPFFATPYIYTGISYFKYDNLYFAGNTQRINDSSWALAIPMTVGVKMKITNKLVLGLESGARYTFVDDIDGSFPKSSDLSGFKFGNLNSKDWYVFTGVTLTYTFGQNPCFCAD